MAEHATGSTPCIKQKAAGYRYWTGDPDQLEANLIKAYKAAHGGQLPPCNVQDPSA
jgi:hypothetical protein